MTRRTVSILILLVAWGAATPTADALQDERPAAESVLIVSVDGLRPDAIEAAGAEVMARLAREGARAAEARTIHPSVTLISHASMLTGLTPDRHGIWWNGWRPERGYVEVDTCLGVAREAGHRTVAFFGKDKLRHLVPPETVDRWGHPAYEAREVARAFADDVTEHGMPGLGFIHFADPDGAGHRHGWMSEEQMEAIRSVDAALERVLRACDAGGEEARVALIVTADHGGMGREHGRPIPEDVRIPWIAWGAGVRAGVTVEERVDTYDTAATALALLGVEVPEGWDGRPVRGALR